MDGRITDTSALVRRYSEMGLTQKALADQAGVALSTLKYVLAGRDATAPVLRKIADALGCNVSDICVFDDSPTVLFYTVAEVAKRMRTSPKQVYQLIHSGKLHAEPLGRTYRIPRSELSRLAREDVRDHVA